MRRIVNSGIASPFLFPFKEVLPGEKQHQNKGTPLDLKEIKQIIDLMKKSDLTEFAVEEENFKLKIRRAGSEKQVVTTISPGPASVAPSPPGPHPTGSTLAPVNTEPVETGITYIKSPMVGTFYASSAPDSPALVEVSQAVEESSIVCIIEAMKIMNEIQAETRGTILEILIENGQPVEFGQRLFKVEAT